MNDVAVTVIMEVVRYRDVNENIFTCIYSTVDLFFFSLKSSVYEIASQN